MKRNFTLIELLTVIAIIAILMGIAVPALIGIRESAKAAKARTNAHDMATAVNSFMTDYRYLPAPSTSSGDTIYNQENAGQKDFYSIMTGETNTIGKKFNKKNICYYAPSDADKKEGKFLDPWLNPFYICLDTNYDGVIEMPAFTDVNENDLLKDSVAIFSIGNIAAGAVSEGNRADRKKMKNFAPSW